MKHNYPQIGADLGKLIAEKQKAYGDSYGKSGELLKVLFPAGVSPANYPNVLAIIRIIDKLFRIATDPNWGGESPWRDIAGYALLRLADEEHTKVEKNPTRLDEVENTHDAKYDPDWFQETNINVATVLPGRDPEVKGFLSKLKVEN